MKKKVASLIFISLCLILSGCKQDFYDYPKKYSSYLDRSLGKWEITSKKDIKEESLEHSVDKRTWLIKGPNEINLELHDSIAFYSNNLSKEEADILFTMQILNNMNHIYSKNVNKNILDASYFYSSELNNEEKYLKKKDNSYAKKVL